MTNNEEFEKWAYPAYSLEKRKDIDVPFYTHAPSDELRQAAEEARIALEPYDDIKPRDWKTDRERLAAAHKRLRDALEGKS